MELGIMNKTAIVTGGATGLGRELVMALASEGANICFTYLDEKEKPENLISAVKNISPVKVTAIKTNLANSDEIKLFFQRTIEEYEHADILINNAGVWLSGYVADISLDDWDFVMNVNLKSVFYLSQLFINHCISRKQAGSILNVTSQAAFHGSTTGHAHYAASKAGLVAFSISLAREVAKKNINVNNIAIGIMDTPMIRGNLQADPDYYVNRIPIGRVASPKEIAQLGIFLVSEKARYMTGATLDATGGMLMR